MSELLSPMMTAEDALASTKANVDRKNAEWAQSQLEMKARAIERLPQFRIECQQAIKNACTQGETEARYLLSWLPFGASGPVFSFHIIQALMAELLAAGYQVVLKVQGTSRLLKIAWATSDIYTQREV